MKRTFKWLGWAHLLITVVSITLMSLHIELFNMLSLSCIGLMGTIVFLSIGALKLDNIIQITFALVAGIVPYLLSYTIYFAPSFIQNNWNLLMVLVLTLLFKVLMVLNQTDSKSQKVFGFSFVLCVCPIIFSMGQPLVWKVGFGLLILIAILVVVLPRVRKEKSAQ